ncbi:MAG: hypothetical protein ROZ64_12120 [Burkholderiaceae bacterium]|jgi:hypothetical protein|nr:hypothetical protein [Burkholderiaceae bacterium]
MNCKPKIARLARVQFAERRVLVFDGEYLDATPAHRLQDLLFTTAPWPEATPKERLRSSWPPLEAHVARRSSGRSNRAKRSRFDVLAQRLRITSHNRYDGTRDVLREIDERHLRKLRGRCKR